MTFYHNKIPFGYVTRTKYPLVVCIDFSIIDSGCKLLCWQCRPKYILRKRKQKTKPKKKQCNPVTMGLALWVKGSKQVDNGITYYKCMKDVRIAYYLLLPWFLYCICNNMVLFLFWFKRRQRKSIVLRVYIIL